MLPWDNFLFIIKHMKKTVIGIVAHVDAGKTTLSESILYLTNTIRKKGRVDHKDTHLDYDNQEKDRGITIFSKQARFNYLDTQFTLIDTPGHVDFSSEMERSLQVLDCAILVINGCDGVQSHTETIWKLLKHHQIPTIVFINKMDISYLSKETILEQLHKLDMNIVDITSGYEEAYDTIATNSEELLEKVLSETITVEDIQQEFNQLHVYPCIFGSALKEDKVDTLLQTLNELTIQKQYPQTFGAKIYKVTHEDNKRWVHMKITGGTLKAKEIINEEKIDQIRLYNMDKYETVTEVFAGDVCTVSGLTLQANDALGYESNNTPILSSYMKYRMLLPKDCDVQTMLRNLQLLADEDPELKISFDDEVKEIHLQLMGEIQIEILKNIIKQRFNVDVDFDHGSVVFMETITEAVEGVGHFEPLRHYAEVHLLLEPLPRGSGLVFDTKCDEDRLAKNWQRLILTHLYEKKHKGVLTGSTITDMKISLVSGKAHIKHTEGGDFRQATYRAVRHGLRTTKSLLLEPYYQYKLVIPSSFLSRAIYDIEQRNGTFTIEENDNDLCILTGKAPVRKLANYQMEVLNYSKGLGKLTCSLDGYDKCVDAEEIITTINYDCDNDAENPCGSVFCEGGAGFYVPYNEVEQYMHLKMTYTKQAPERVISAQPRKYNISDEELKRVVSRIHGPERPKKVIEAKKVKAEDRTPSKPVTIKKKCVLVDGYNIIHSWEELKELASHQLDAARDKLIDLLSSYQAYKKCLLIVVFDAYKVKSHVGSQHYNGNIHIVFTKTAQTADEYIEKTAHELSKDYQITVATSDALEQLIVFGQGAVRISAREFEREIKYLHTSNTKEYQSKQTGGHYPLQELRKLNEE